MLSRAALQVNGALHRHAGEHRRGCDVLPVPVC